MIKKLREKLSYDERSLKWFHKYYIGSECKYGYFIRQINIPDSIQDNVKRAIKKYLSEV
jgi:hypothetical protein